MRRLLAAFALLLLAPSGAQAAVTLAQIGNFTAPVYVTGDTERVYVVEKGGKIVMVRGATRTTYLDISGRIDANGSEEGLLSMALSGTRLFVFYTAPRGGAGSILTVSEFAATPDSADSASERVVLRIPHPTNDNHNGGLLQLGPDGMLWIGVGDGGSGGDPDNNAQTTSSLLGKLLRIDPNPGGGCGGSCTIPAGNAGLGAPEIWAYGLRNPWRFSFDRTTGDLWIGDVGQDRFEEIDFAAAPGRGVGADWGWDAKEGFELFSGGVPVDGKEVDPVLAYGRGDGRRSVVGGVVVRDPHLPDLLGKYLFADTYAGPIYAGTLSGGRLNAAPTALQLANPVSFGEDTCGRVYVASIQGPVYRLSDSGACGTPGAPGVPGAPGTPENPGGGAADSTAPRVTLRAASRQRPLRTARVRFTASCDEQCALTARGTFTIRRAGSAAAKPLRTGTLRRTLAPGAKVGLEFRVARSVRRSLRRALARGRRVTVTFAVSARDSVGNTRRSPVRARVVR